MYTRRKSFWSKLQDGKLDEVKKALDKRMETVEQTWSTYLPEQYELVKNRKTLEEGNVIAIVIADQADAILQKISDSLNAAVSNMVFSSLPFLFGYLPVVLTVLKLVPLHARNFCLFLVSLIFYGWSEPVYIVII